MFSWKTLLRHIKSQFETISYLECHLEPTPSFRRDLLAALKNPVRRCRKSPRVADVLVVVFPSKGLVEKDDSSSGIPPYTAEYMSLRPNFERSPISDGSIRGRVGEAGALGSPRLGASGAGGGDTLLALLRFGRFVLRATGGRNMLSAALVGGAPRPVDLARYTSRCVGMIAMGWLQNTTPESSTKP